MPPYEHNAQGGASAGDAAKRMHDQQTKLHLENRLRILKNQVIDKNRILHDIERDTQALDIELHRLEQDDKRLSEEVRRMSLDVRADEGASKQSESGMRETNQALQRKEDDTRKLERDIERLRAQITEKETEIAFVKQEVSKLMKEKEDFRRAHELGHFTMKSENEHVRDRQVRLTLLAQELKRKENEVAHKQQMHQELKRDMSFKEQEIMQVEAELGRMH